MLRDWTNSEKVDTLSFQAEVFFIRLIMRADDYGCFYADTRLLKANLFPLRLDKVREADLTRWMAECQKAGLIVLYQAENQKKYLQVVDFRQRLDKAKAKYPLPPSNTDSLEIVNDFPPESESDNETDTEKNRAKALVGDADENAGQGLKNDYKKLIDGLNGTGQKEVWILLKDFITANRPQFAEPYIDIWNIFAINYKLPKVEVISDSRRRKFKTRFPEPGFDFLGVLEKIKTSAHLRGNNNSGWSVTLDWVIENDKNYLKVLEGNYN